MLNRDNSRRPVAIVVGLGLLAGVGFGLQQAMQPPPPESARAIAPLPPTDPNDVVRRRLTARWQKQRDAMHHGRFEVVRATLAAEEGQEIRRDQFDGLVSGLNLNDVPSFLQKVLDLFPVPPDETRGPLEPIEFCVDGSRRLQRGGARDPRHRVCDDKVCVDFWPANRQASVSDGSLGIIHPDDLHYLPGAGEKPLTEGWQILGTTSGRVKLRYRDEVQVREIEGDAETGFIHRHLSTHTAESKSENVILQFGPVVDRIGRVVPTLRLDAQFNNDKLLAVSVSHIIKADLDATFTAADFIVGVPAGTKIIDLRGDHESPKYGFSRTAVPDVLAFVGALPDNTRSVGPRLTGGTPAPSVVPAVWLTQKGEVGPPEVKGKVLLIDFWGTFCGPCVAELPRVQEAAKKYAGSDLVVIGLHTAGARAEEVAEFARKKGLTYLLGIDRSGDDTNSFGATFQAFGVHGVPGAAVIDRDGRLVFVGSFCQGLQKAEEVLNGKRHD